MPVPKLFWPTALMPDLLAIRQSRNLFNFRKHKLFIDYIFHVLHTEVVFKVPVAEGKAEKLPYNFVYVSGAITLSQLRPRQQPISSQNEGISVKDDCSTLKSLCCCVAVVAFAV